MHVYQHFAAKLRYGVTCTVQKLIKIQILNYWNAKRSNTYDPIGYIIALSTEL